MVHELTFASADAHCRRAAWQWFSQANPWSYALALVLVITALGLVFSSGGLRVFCALLFGAVAGYFVLFAVDWLRRRPDPGEIHVVIDDSGLAWHSKFGDSRLPWRSLKRLDLSRDYVFVTVESGHVLLPRAALTAEAIRFLIEHTIEAGGLVRGARVQSDLPVDEVAG